MILPLLLLFIALVAGAVVGYGTLPWWGQFPHGLQWIMFSRRFEWPLITLSILCCVVLLALIVAGKRRAWWLIGLAPVLTLFFHHFAVDPTRGLQVTDIAVFTPAEQASFLQPEDFVVGVVYRQQAYAFPYAALYASPVVLTADQTQRLLVIWSAFANRALANAVDRSIKPESLEIVSMPSNALLVYNARLGQFINGITGLTPSGQRPAGFLSAVATEKMPWHQWQALHPQSLVWTPPKTTLSHLPTGPIPPYYPMPGGHVPDGRRFAFIATTQPALVAQAAVADEPLNVHSGEEPLLLYRDHAGELRAFERIANGDLIPRFELAPPPHPASVEWIDTDSNSKWAIDGRVISGPLKGEKLAPVEVDEDVYADVMRFWYPTLKTLTPTPADVQLSPEALANGSTGAATSHPTPQRRPRRRRRTRGVSAALARAN